jgi:hypothetical protein
MIVKRSGGYHVVSEKGKNLGGPYKSRKKAKKRLAQIEAFKHMNKGDNMSDKDVKYVILEKGAMGKEERKRAGKRRSKERKAEKKEDIKVYGESLD